MSKKIMKEGETERKASPSRNIFEDDASQQVTPQTMIKKDRTLPETPTKETTLTSKDLSPPGDKAKQNLLLNLPDYSLESIDCGPGATVHIGASKDSRKRFPNWDSSDEDSPAKTLRKIEAPFLSEPRKKMSKIQFQERCQLLLGIWPNAKEDSLRKAIEVMDTAGDTKDWFWGLVQRTGHGESKTKLPPKSNLSYGMTKSNEEMKEKTPNKNPVTAEDVDDIVPLDSDGDDANGADDDTKMENTLAKVSLPE